MWTFTIIFLPPVTARKDFAKSRCKNFSILSMIITPPSTINFNICIWSIPQFVFLFALVYWVKHVCLWSICFFILLKLLFYLNLWLLFWMLHCLNCIQTVILGLTLEESTDISVLNRKFDQLDRQLKELNISLKTRFLPKTQKLQLKDTLDKKARNILDFAICAALKTKKMHFINTRYIYITLCIIDYQKSIMLDMFSSFAVSKKHCYHDHLNISVWKQWALSSVINVIIIILHLDIEKLL